MRRTAALAALLLSLVLTAFPQSLELDRERARGMLQHVDIDIRRHYYDPQFKGLNWDQMVAQAKARIDAAKSPGEMFSAIFALVGKLQDSHTIFVPPRRSAKILFGFNAKPVGNSVLIYELKKDGAAERAGLRLGDRILTVNGYRAERDTYDVMMLFFRAVQPQAALEIVYSRGDQPPQKLLLNATIEQGTKIVNLTEEDTLWKLIREQENDRLIFHWDMMEGGIGYLQLPEFASDELKDFAKHVSHADATIIDLRGNPGGAVTSLEQFAGCFDAKENDIATSMGRKETRPMKVKPLSPQFPGPMFILVDSESSSAAEIFARHFQLEKRAVVIGDQTPGRVEEAKLYFEDAGNLEVIPYMVEVSEARVVFPGGEELEKKGVTPDVMCLPTGADLAAGKDPCLTRAYVMAREALKLPPLVPQPAAAEKK